MAGPVDVFDIERGLSFWVVTIIEWPRTEDSEE